MNLRGMKLFARDQGTIIKRYDWCEPCLTYRHNQKELPQTHQSNGTDTVAMILLK